MERRVAIALCCLLALGVGYLLLGPDPWNDGVARAIERDRAIRPVDYAATWCWWAALLNTGVVAVLLATRRLWLGELGRPPSADPAETGRTGPPGRAGFALLVLAAMLAAAVLAAPRLDHSLWGDEEWTVRKGIDGAYVPARDGEIVFDEVLWHETFFYYRRPSNHVGYSVPARLSLAAWRSVAQPDTRFVSETAVRMPAFLAGLGAVAAVALLLRRLGLPGAGVLAAWALALHPWFLRYASEARGYALLLLLCPLSLWLLSRALARGSWPRWLLYGLAQFWMLWTWPPIGFFLVFANAAALGGLWVGSSGERGPRRREPWMRWFVATAMGWLLFLQLMAGNLVQLAQFRDHETGAGGGGWFANLGGHFLAAVRWGPETEHYLEAADLAAGSPTLFWGLAVVSALALVTGVLRLVSGGGVRAWFALPLLLPGPALLVYAQARGLALNPWFLIHVLPGIAALIATGLGSLGARLPGRTGWVVAAAGMTGWLLAFAWVTQPARVALRAGSLQPMRESVLLTRPDLDPHAPGQARVLTAAISRGPTYYDPRFVFIERVAALEALIARAEADGLPLYVNSGRPALADRRVPELVEFVERSGRFEEVAILYGFEPRGQRRVYRYQGDRGR